MVAIQVRWTASPNARYFWRSLSRAGPAAIGNSPGVVAPGWPGVSGMVIYLRDLTRAKARAPAYAAAPSCVNRYRSVGNGDRDGAERASGGSVAATLPPDTAGAATRPWPV